MSASETYFVAATTVTSGPTSSLHAREARADLAQATAPITPCTPRARPLRRCEKKSSGWSRVQRSTRSTRLDARPREARARRRSRDRACRRASGRRRRGPTPPSRPRSSTGRSPARSRPPSRPARAPRPRPATTPSESPRQPACRTASARGPSPVRATAIGRQSADIASSGTSALVRPEAVARHAAQPGVARCTVGECTCRLKASRSAGRPSDSHAIRRFSSTRSGSSPVPRVRLSESYGASLTPPSAGRERDDVPGLVPPDHASSSRARSSSCSRVFRLGSRTTSCRSAWSVRPISGPGL